MASNYIDIPVFGSKSWKDPVATATALPSLGNSQGDVRVTLDTDLIYIWTGATWTTNSGSSGVTSLNSLTGALNIAAGPGANLSVSGSTITIGATPNAVQAVEIPFIATTAVSATQMVIAVSNTTAAPGNNTTTIQNARVLGIALTSAAMGGNFTALLFGTIVDASFSGFTINDPVYLNASGYLTQTVPVHPNFLVSCGKYLGANTVYINVVDPVQL